MKYKVFSLGFCNIQATSCENFGYICKVWRHHDGHIDSVLSIYRSIEGRELIIAVEKGCLAEKAGVEVWDIVVELCGQPVHNIPSGRVSIINR